MKIGDLFKSVAGKSPAEFKDFIGVERAAQAALGHAITIEPFESELVPKRGNVFEVRSYPGDLDRDVDAANEWVMKFCKSKN
jgi:hypothetical protein